MKLNVFLVSLLFLLSGCAHRPSLNNIILVSDVNKVYGERNESARLLKSVDGLDYTQEISFIFRTVPAEKNFSGYWAWKPDPNGKWICGSYNPANNEIILAANPKNGYDYNSDVAVHEFAHFWRYTLYRDVTHSDRYSGVLFNWHASYDTRSVGIHYDSLPDSITGGR